MTDSDDTLYHIAVSMLKPLTVPVLNDLDERDIPLREFIETDDIGFISMTGVHPPQGLDEASRQVALQMARKELEFVKRHNIRVLWYADDGYPYRLAQIESPPPCIFAIGDCDLNSPHPVSVVGTRRMTPYGAEIARRITSDLAKAFPDLLVVSGLAFGVDSIGHRTALEEGVTTAAVVAHGLDMIYPAQHRDLAKRIIEAGGAIISQYPSGTRPFRQNFLERNRIVAGMSDATIVVESDIKGGAMSTARHALEADREVLAVPGRITDTESAGCNLLIRTNRAKLVTSAADVIEDTGWRPENSQIQSVDRSLFPELEGEAKVIYDLLQTSADPLQLDLICHSSGIPVSRLMGLLNELEFDGIIIRHPGNRFSCNG